MEEFVGRRMRIVRVFRVLDPLAHALFKNCVIEFFYSCTLRLFLCINRTLLVCL